MTKRCGGKHLVYRLAFEEDGKTLSALAHEHSLRRTSARDRPSSFSSLKKERIRKFISEIRSLTRVDIFDYIEGSLQPYPTTQSSEGVSSEAFESVSL